jgi:two-component system chemotaxis response regulator CheB
MNDKIRVLIVDDSTLMREALRHILEQDPRIEIVGTARDGREGVEKALALKPDVITMDLRMPVMSGLEAIENIMEESPVPIIVVSSMDITVIVKALSIGAMDFVAVANDIDALATELLMKVRVASHVRPLKRMKIKQCTAKAPKPTRKSELSKVVAIGVSTGGPQALQEIFGKFAPDIKAGFLVVQHISKGFIEGLAEWLNTNSCLHVQVAKSGDRLKNGIIMLAPDNYHMRVNADGVISFSENTSKFIAHVPSIDIMMKSVADSFGEDAVGVIMTGMGSDGVEGMKEIKKAGGSTIAQDEKSSVVFGMNKMAIDNGIIDRVVPLDRIAAEIKNMVL